MCYKSQLLYFMLVPVLITIVKAQETTTGAPVETTTGAPVETTVEPPQESTLPISLELWRASCLIIGRPACTSVIQSVIVGYSVSNVDLVAHANCLKQTTNSTCSAVAENSCIWCPIAGSKDGDDSYYSNKYGDGACITSRLQITGVDVCASLFANHIKPVDEESTAYNAVYPKFSEQAACLELSQIEANCTNLKSNDTDACSFCKIPELIYGWNQEGGICFDKAYMETPVENLTKCQQINALGTAQNDSTQPVVTTMAASSGFAATISLIALTFSVSSILFF